MNVSKMGFIWYELMTTDADAAANFYGSVVGWKIPGRAAPEGKDYRPIVRSDGGSAGGVLQLSSGEVARGARPTWLGYLGVADVDQATAAIVSDGGRVLMAKMTLPVGDIAMVADPMGAPFYVMRPVPPPGQADKKSDVFHPTQAQHVRWNELLSPDLSRAGRFYAKHFGFELRDTMPMGDHGDYHFIDLEGARLGGMMTSQPSTPGGWQFYFGVPSVTAAKRAVEAGGGKIVMDVHQVPGGDWVMIAVDPQGASFGLVGSRGE